MQWQFWGLLLPLYSVFHCLTISTFLLALLLFSSADKWGLTWFQEEGCVLTLVRHSCEGTHWQPPSSPVNILITAACAVVWTLGIQCWKCWKEELVLIPPPGNSGFHTRIGTSCYSHWWVSELSRLWQQHSKGGDWWEQDSGTSGCKKWHHEEKSHHEGRCWHLASVLLLLNQESVCALTAAWHNVSSAEARLLNSVPGLQRTPGCHNLLAAM